MSDLSPLSDLAQFAARSPLASQDRHARGVAMTGLTRRLGAVPSRRKVSELLGIVLALSSRTRRVIQPRVGIDLDVFGPEGHRAVRLVLPHPGE